MTERAPEAKQGASIEIATTPCKRLFFQRPMNPNTLDLPLESLVGGRVRKIRRVGALEVALTLHQPSLGESHWILSADPDGARFLRTFEPTPAPERPGSFVLLASARITGGRIAFATQRQGQIVELKVDSGEVSHSLVLEINGRESRLLLLDAASLILIALPGEQREGTGVGVAYAPPSRMRRLATCTPPRLPPIGEDQARQLEADWNRHLRERADAEARKLALRRIRAHLAKLARRAAHIEADRAGLADAGTLRRWGDLLQIHRHALRHGLTEIAVTDEFQTERPTITIPLDPALSPAANIEALFRGYRKRMDGLEHIERRRAATVAEQKRWEGIIERVEAGTNSSEAGLAILLDSLSPAERTIAAPPPVRRGRPDAKAGPITRISSDGYTIFVGRSKVENDEVTFRIGRGKDWWFHALGIPGAHVLVRNPSGNPLPPATQREAAWLAAYYSKGRARGSMEVAATQRKYVRKIKGGEPGAVTYAHGHTLWIDLSDARGRAILGGDEGIGTGGFSEPG